MTEGELAKVNRPLLRRGVRRSTDPLTGEAVLLFPEGVLVMNETAACIVGCCDGDRTVGDVVEMLSDNYAGVRADDVVDLLNDLVAQHLMVGK